MTEKEILEGNKLIGLFMGAKYYNDDPKEFPDGYYMAIDADSFTKLDWGLEVRDWNFHCSWDWLIPVVEKISKISSIHFTINTREIGRYKPWVTIEYGNFKPLYIKSTKEDVLIETIYKGIIHFLKWYNEQNK